MKGYKYLGDGMKDPFMKDCVYELGKKYIVEDESKLEIGKYGFHFFATFKDLFMYRHYDDEDIYEIEAEGTIFNENNI